MQHKLLKSLLLVCGLNAVTGWAQPMTVDLLPVRDNTLYERPLGDLSNGAGEYLFFGMTGPNAGNVLRRAVLAFDLSAIPTDSLVNDVSLTISVNMVPPGATSFDASVHRISTDWGEGTSDAPGPEGGGTGATPDDATWLHTFFDTMLWTTPGGDFQPQPSAVTSLSNGNGEFAFDSAQLIADVQAMVSNPAGNFGWIILGDETGDMNARRISSRENISQPDTQPVLTVSFEAGVLPPPPPPLPPPAAVPALSAVSLLILISLLLCATAVAGLRR